MTVAHAAEEDEAKDADCTASWCSLISRDQAAAVLGERSTPELPPYRAPGRCRT